MPFLFPGSGPGQTSLTALRSAAGKGFLMVMETPPHCECYESKVEAAISNGIFAGGGI